MSTNQTILHKLVVAVPAVLMTIIGLAAGADNTVSNSLFIGAFIYVIVSEAITFKLASGWKPPRLISNEYVLRWSSCGLPLFMRKRDDT